MHITRNRFCILYPKVSQNWGFSARIQSYEVQYLYSCVTVVELKIFNFVFCTWHNMSQYKSIMSHTRLFTMSRVSPTCAARTQLTRPHWDPPSIRWSDYHMIKCLYHVTTSWYVLWWLLATFLDNNCVTWRKWRHSTEMVSLEGNGVTWQKWCHLKEMASL